MAVRFWPHEPVPFGAEREAATAELGGFLGRYSPSESKGAGTRGKRHTHGRVNEKEKGSDFAKKSGFCP